VKHIRIGLTIGFLAFALICLIDRCNAEEYRVNDFIGGINVATDSTDLLPNQALNLTNLTFDMPNVLTSREGYSYWNATAFSGHESDEVDGITIYEDNFYSVLDGWPYRGSSRLSFTGDSMRVFNDSNYVYDIGDNDWLGMKVGYGDEIVMGGQTDTISVLAKTDDTTIVLFNAYDGASDTLESYTVRKYLGSFGSFAEYDGILYMMSDSLYSGFITVYNDTSYKFLAVIDSGTVTTAIDLDTSTFVVAGDCIHLGGPSGKRAMNLDRDHPLDGCGATSGDIFYYYYQWQSPDASRRISDATFYSKIDSIDTTGYTEYIFIEDRFVPWGHVVHNCNPWEIRREATVPIVDSTFGGLADGSKNWFDIEFGDKLYTGFYDIYNNDDTILVVDSYVSTGISYYIMSGVPTTLLRNNIFVDSLYKEQPRIKQILFYNNQWYGIGMYAAGTWTGWIGYPNPFGDLDTLYTQRYNRVFYSHIGYPIIMMSLLYYSQFGTDFTSVLQLVSGSLLAYRHWLIRRATKC
jgi:hypothetical protein